MTKFMMTVMICENDNDKDCSDGGNYDDYDDDDDNDDDEGCRGYFLPPKLNL